MNLTYEEIISQISMKMGYTGLDGELKANLRYAIRFAEERLFSKSGIVKREQSINIIPTQERYNLPYDYNSPSKIVFFDVNGNQLESISIQPEEFMDNKNTVNSTDYLSNDDIEFAGNSLSDMQSDSRYNNKIIYTIDFRDSYYQIAIKPPITATCKVYYSAVPIDNLYTNLANPPTLPQHYHMYIIYGAVAYLAENEASKKIREKDIESGTYYIRLSKEMGAKFSDQIEEVGASAMRQPEPQVIKSFTWYDNPRKYRQGR